MRRRKSIGSLNGGASTPTASDKRRTNVPFTREDPRMRPADKSLSAPKNKSPAPIHSAGVLMQKKSLIEYR
jgi:hypothetical protein